MIRDELFPIREIAAALESRTIDLCVCPVCGKVLHKDEFKPFGVRSRPNVQCPACRTLERHRVYALYFKRETDLLKKAGQRILHFAPEAGLSALFSQAELQHDYYPVDFDPNFKGDIRMTVDITDIPFPDDFFDAVIANHVIEHIPDEQKALREVARVLKPDGTAYINAPVFNIPRTIEDPAYNTPELRTQHYGQHDHVRKYGVDYIEHLKKAFPYVDRISYVTFFHEEERRLFHLPGPSTHADIYCCRKINTVPNPEADKYRNEIELIHTSWSYRIGRFITFIPRKIRGGIYCYKEHGLSYTWQRFLVHLHLKKDPFKYRR